MNTNAYIDISPLLNMDMSTKILFIIMIVWIMVWKGFAIWIAAQEKNKYWFIIILVINTLGILEMIYIFFFSKRGRDYVSKWSQWGLKNPQKEIEFNER